MVLTCSEISPPMLSLRLANFLTLELIRESNASIAGGSGGGDGFGGGGVLTAVEAPGVVAVIVGVPVVPFSNGPPTEEAISSSREVAASSLLSIPLDQGITMVMMQRKV